MTLDQWRELGCDSQQDHWRFCRGHFESFSAIFIEVLDCWAVRGMTKNKSPLYLTGFDKPFASKEQAEGVALTLTLANPA